VIDSDGYTDLYVSFIPDSNYLTSISPSYNITITGGPYLEPLVVQPNITVVGVFNITETYIYPTEVLHGTGTVTLNYSVVSSSLTSTVSEQALIPTSAVYPGQVFWYAPGNTLGTFILTPCSDTVMDRGTEYYVCDFSGLLQFSPTIAQPIAFQFNPADDLVGVAPFPILFEAINFQTAIMYPNFTVIGTMEIVSELVYDDTSLPHLLW
jgi:hypothetical protein